MRTVVLLGLVLTLGAEVRDRIGEMALNELERLKVIATQLPVPPVAPIQQGAPPFDPATLAKTGVHIQDGQVVLAGTAVVDQGPVDGLEVMACLEGGKVHESYARLHTGRADLIKAACLAGLGVLDGRPALEESAVPARGEPILIDVWWQPDPDFEPGVWRGAPLSAMVRDRVSGHSYPIVPYVYTGSRVQEIRQSVPGGGVVEAERFMLEITKSVVVNFDEPDALLASPFLFASRDDLFEVNGKLAPPKGTKVYFVLHRAQAPLVLEPWVEPGLGPLADKAVMVAKLQATFAKAGPEVPRFVQIPIADGISADEIWAFRYRLLEAAIAARIWVVPVFTPIR